MVGELTPWEGAGMKSLHLALLVSLNAATASAQTAPATNEGFRGFTAGRTVSIIDRSGSTTTGRLLFATPDTLTVAANGDAVVFDQKSVAAVFEQGTSVKKGLLLGLASGPVLGVAALLTNDVPGAEGEIALAAVMFSAIGAAIGTAIDAMIPGKRLIYATADFEPEDSSSKNGIIIGSVAGAATGFTAGALKDDCDHTPNDGPAYFTPVDCTAGEKVVHGLKSAALAGLAGAGIGIVVDRLIVRPHLGHRISVNPSFSRRGLNLSTSVSW